MIRPQHGKKQTDNKRTREIKGAVCLALGLFLLLCLVSYHPQDPSFTHFVAGDHTTHNFTGKAGSYTADSLIRLLGAASLLFPLMLFVCSFKYFRSSDFRIGTGRLIGFLFFIFSFAGIMALLISGSISLYGESLKNGTGGLTGVAIVGLLRNYFNVAGTYIILFLIFVVSLTFLVDFSMISFTEKISKSGAAFLLRWKERIMAFVDFVFNRMKSEPRPRRNPLLSKKRRT